MHRGGEGGEVREFCFVPHVLQELHAHEFTVSIYPGV